MVINMDYMYINIVLLQVACDNSHILNADIEVGNILSIFSEAVPIFFRKNLEFKTRRLCHPLKIITTMPKRIKTHT